MSKFIGRLADVGVAIETTRGTAESAADFWLPKMSLTLDDEIEQVIDESSLGVIADSSDAVVVGKFATGEVEGKIGDKSIGTLLLATMGTVSTTTTQSTAYIHTFSVDESAQHDSLTLFLDDPNQDYKYALAMIDSMEFDFALGQYAKFMASFRAKVGSTASLTPSYSVENNFLPQHGTLQYADDLAGLSSPTSVNIRSCRLTINKNVEDDRKLGSLDPVDILNKQMSVEGSMELVFDAETFKTEMLADTEKAVRIQFTNSDVTIGSSLNPRLQINLARVKFGSFTRNYGNNDIVTATVDFKAFYSTADSEQIEVELRNAQSSYA